jgi:AcrR family transcriptional regulator
MARCACDLTMLTPNERSWLGALTQCRATQRNLNGAHLAGRAANAVLLRVAKYGTEYHFVNTFRATCPYTSRKVCRVAGVRRHGWGGNPPEDDEAAIRRILDAAHRCIERDGDVGIAEVAREVGVTRQTVYRYFRTTDALVVAAATDGASGLLERIESHLAGVSRTPSEGVVEGVAFTLEQLPHEPALGLVLTPSRLGVLSRDFTSPTAIALGRLLINRFASFWESAGYRDDELDELVEHILRIIVSFTIDPGTPPRSGDDLRDYLRRWVAPAVEALSRPAGHHQH